MNLYKSAIANSDKFITEIRRNARYEKTPMWDSNEIGYLVTNELEPDVREKLLKCKGGIWPKNATEKQKADFLDCVGEALCAERHQVASQLSPKEQQEKLDEVCKSIAALKKQMNLLRGEALLHAELAFILIKYKKALVDELYFSHEYGEYVDSVLSRAWMSLSDLENVLGVASERIKPSRQNKPSKYEYSIFLKNLAVMWFVIFDQLPPKSKNGCFAKLLAELGSLLDKKFPQSQVRLAASAIETSVAGRAQKDEMVMKAREYALQHGVDFVTAYKAIGGK